MYDSVYTLMHWLRPRVLDELGLQNVLEGTFFQFKLLKSNVRYSGTVSGDCLLLTDEQTIGIFRIVQDAVTNVSKLRNISSLHCQLSIQATSIDLTITDDRLSLGHRETTINDDINSEYQSVINRVISLGGKMRINADDGLILTITLPP